MSGSVSERASSEIATLPQKHLLNVVGSLLHGFDSRVDAGRDLRRYISIEQFLNLCVQPRGDDAILVVQQRERPRVEVIQEKAVLQSDVASPIDPACDEVNRAPEHPIHFENSLTASIFASMSIKLLDLSYDDQGCDSCCCNRDDDGHGDIPGQQTDSPPVHVEPFLHARTLSGVTR